MNMEEDPLTLSDHTFPKHTDGGSLRVAHIVESLLSSFLYNKIDCGWKVIFSHLIQTVKEKEQQNWEKNISLLGLQYLNTFIVDIDT